MTLRTAAFASIALALLVAACGGGDGGPTVVPNGDGGPTAVPNGDGRPTMLPNREGRPTVLPDGRGGPTVLPNGQDGPVVLPDGQDGPTMLLNIEADECDNPDRPTECRVLVGTSFTLSVNAAVVPREGYILAATYVDFGDDLIYNPAESPADEMVWPDCEPAALISGQDNPEVVNHGCISGLIEPIASMHVGNLVDLSFTCSSEPSRTLVGLLPYNDPVAITSGTLFVEFGTNLQIVPKVGSLTISCVPPRVES